MGEVVLPKKKVESSLKSPKNLLIYGIPKVGKTTLLSTLENALILDLEEGSNYVDALKINIKSLDHLQEVGTAIIKNNRPYKYIVVDTVTKLEDMCLDYAKKLYMETAIGKNFDGDSVMELPQGAGYYWWRKAFFEWVNKIKKLADYVIFIGHLKEKLINKKGTEVTQKDIDLTGKMKDIICAIHCDSIGYLYRNSDKQLVLNFNTNEDLICGTRSRHLAGKEVVIADYDYANNCLKDVKWNEIYID